MKNLLFVFSPIVAVLASPIINSNQQSVLVEQPPVAHWPPRKLSLPYEDPTPHFRRQEVLDKRAGFLYGPSLLGNTSFFPSGPLGDALTQEHQSQWYRDAAWLTETVEVEAISAMQAITQAGGLKNLSDYEILYRGQWGDSVPSGIARGASSNFTSDLLFAMERLSANPYAIRRLHPTADQLPFLVDAAIVRAVARKDLVSLHREGRLFYVDHSSQKDYPVSPGTYTAACEAYFFLDAQTDQLLPLAIKTNVGADLVYSPLDLESDWLLAKAMFNQNDLFHGQIFHLANSHAVAEIVHQAAVRSMSSNHPIMALLDRLMHQAYAIRPVGERVLFNDGGFFDRTFAVTNHGVRMFATEFYPKVASMFQANYFDVELRRRGLINSTYGPALPSFPFHDEGLQIILAIREYVSAYVHEYYATDGWLALDDELQSWIIEANGPAMVVDFVSAPISSTQTLVDVLTHMAWLCGVSHHVLNGGSPVATTGVLPLHPAALYAPVPQRKGVEDIMPFLPNEAKAVEHIALLARFNRPRLVSQHETLLHMFDDRILHEQGRSEVSVANERFMKAMRSISEAVRQKAFGADGLCQGMPIIWAGLDPAEIPFFLGV